VTRFNILEMTDKLEMGRYFFASVLSRPVFLNRNVMYADLNDCGMRPKHRDALNSRQINSTSSAVHYFSSQVGSGSERHCLFGRAR